MENAIENCGKIFDTYIRIDNDQGVIQFLSNKKNWTDSNFFQLSQNRSKFIVDACSVVCYCQIVLNPKLNMKRLGKCPEVVNNALSIIECNALPAKEFLGRLIVRDLNNSTRLLLKKYNFMRRIQNFGKDFQRILENELEKRLRLGLKALFFCCERKMLVRILSLGLQLSFYNILKRNDCCILRYLAYQFLENWFDLHQVQGAREGCQGVDDGVVICKIIEIIDDGRDPFGVLGKFAGRVYDYKSVEANLVKYPCTLNKNIEHQQNLTEITEAKMILEVASEQIKVTKYTCKNNSNFNFTIKNYNCTDASLIKLIKSELTYYQKITKLSTKKNFSTEILLNYSNPSPSQLILYFSSFSLPYISFLSSLASSKRHIEELDLKRISLSLLKTCHNLEKKKAHHGNLKPHHLYLNQDYAITISNFPFSGIVDYDSFYADNSVYIQGVNGYTAPEAPKKFCPQFSYRTNKSEVFSVGLILIQSYLLEPVDSISQSQETLNLYTSHVKYDWLRTLLTQMLVFDHNHRSTFKDLYSIIKKY